VWKPGGSLPVAELQVIVYEPQLQVKQPSEIVRDGEAADQNGIRLGQSPAAMPI